MKTAAILFILLSFSSCCSAAGEKEEEFFREKIVPVAREFIVRNNISYGSKFDTNHIAKHTIEFYNDDRPEGLTTGQAWMYLENRNSFHFRWTNDGIPKIWSFKDGNVKTYYHLDFAPKEKIDAVKALNLKNKLNDKTALSLATKYFKLQGHKEENFNSPIVRQLHWSKTDAAENNESRLLPYYRAEWYRKDVDLKDLKKLEEAGTAWSLPVVIIEISGITSNLISYLNKLPNDTDFDLDR